METVEVHNKTRYRIAVGDGTDAPVFLERKSKGKVPKKIWDEFIKSPSVQSMLKVGRLVVVKPQGAVEAPVIDDDTPTDDVTDDENLDAVRAAAEERVGQE